MGQDNGWMEDNSYIQAKAGHRTTYKTSGFIFPLLATTYKLPSADQGLHQKTQVQLLYSVDLISAFVLYPGQSMITFIYDFVERFEGPHPGYAVISGRPLSGLVLR